MNPPYCYHIVLNLGFEQLNFISHVAVVLMALLSWHYQMCNEEVAIFLSSCQNCTSLHFNGSV